MFLDLRKENLENRYSLPIKLFYYMALGRPVIFSENKAIKRDVDIQNFGSFVDPERTDEIVKIISEYIQNCKLYLTHCSNARKMAEQKYNWHNISPEFIRLIDLMAPSH